MSDAVWLAIIGLIALVIKEYFDRLRSKDAAEKVAKVAEDLEKNEAKHSDLIVGVSKQVEEVHRATNGMKKELVEEVRQASFAQGVKSEQDKN